MAKHSKAYKGDLKSFPSYKIYINVNHLEEGVYALHIVHNKAIIKKVIFKK